MFRNISRQLAAVVVASILIALFQSPHYLPSFGRSPTGCRTFVETGRIVCGRFLDHWTRYGGLAQFGFPISNEFSEVSALDGNRYTVQYFERAVFELHPENRPPYDVLLSHLGTLRFNSMYPKGQPGPPYVENLPVYPGARDVTVVHSEGADKNVTTFLTNDKPQAVLAFYKDVMTKAGWILEEQRYPNALAFTYPRKPDEPLYAVYVLAEVLNERQTKVTVRLQITYRR